FPACFLLVAVPWPSLIEEPLSQSLSRAIAQVTSEALSLAGTPAVACGNRGEVGGGVVEIEGACSGIRSLQVGFMLSVFFGELLRLGVPRRLWLVVAGFCLALVPNALRTTALAAAGANLGPAAIKTWHDPAGLVMPLACFTGIWLLARAGSTLAQEKS